MLYELYSSRILIGELMATPVTNRNGAILISALKVRSQLGQVLDRLEREGESLVIEKRGRPRAVLLSIREYVKLAAPEPDVLKIIGDEATRKGASSLTRRQIDGIVRTSRMQNKRR